MRRLHVCRGAGSLLERRDRGKGQREKINFSGGRGKVDCGTVWGQKLDATLAAINFPIIYLITFFAHYEICTVIFKFSPQNL